MITIRASSSFVAVPRDSVQEEGNPRKKAEDIISMDESGVRESVSLLVCMCLMDAGNSQVDHQRHRTIGAK